MSISDIMEIGRQGLSANRRALQTTSQNVANANTPGYSRQRPVLVARERWTTDSTSVGGGVDVTQVIRIHDNFIEKRIWEEAKDFGKYRTQADGIKRIEASLYNDGNHMGDLINRFFNDYRELSLNPESSTIRASVANSAGLTATGFKKLNESFENMSNDLDWQIKATISDINSNTKELAKLNESIFQFQAVGENANELQDRRDNIVREISQKLGLQVSVDTNDRMNIVAPGVGILVNGGEAYELYTQKSGEREGKADGCVDIYLKDINGNKVVTHGIQDGEVAGMLYVRDKVLHPTLEKLDKLAYEFSKSVNDVHRQGVGVDGAGERNIFKELGSSKSAAKFLELSDDVKRSHESIAASIEPNKPGDNRLALAMADLQTQSKIADLGQFSVKQATEFETNKLYTFNESFNSLVGNVGTQVKMQDSAFQHQGSILDQLENYKQTVSGVSLEEEAIGIIQFQNAFNANAKMMKVSDELLQTILTIKT